MTDPFTVAHEAADKVRGILARSHVEDWDALRLTTCYAADRCQGDLGCPFLAGCQSVGAEPDDDDDDDYYEFRGRW